MSVEKLRLTVLASLMAALTAAGSYIQVPIGPVPIVLTNLFVLLAGLLLGGRKAKFLALPILRRSLLRAEEVTLALAARGYRDDVPLHLPKINLSHFIPLLSFLAISFFYGLIFSI